MMPAAGRINSSAGRFDDRAPAHPLPPEPPEPVRGAATVIVKTRWATEASASSS